jgi:hypothetical protein
MKLFAIVSLALVIGACGNPQQRQNQRQADNYKFDTGIKPLDVSYTSETDPILKDTNIQIKVDNKVVDLTVNEQTGLKSLDGHGIVLSDDEKKAISQFAMEYANKQNLNERSSNDQKMVFSALDYLSQMPKDHAVTTRTYNDLNLANEGITCIRKGTVVTAQWNTRYSGYVAENIVVGTNWPNGYGCMGRCGSDCGWGAPSAWTKDCMDHDACSYRNKASGGASDPNCGDEFNEAADDWIGGVWRGCRG